MITSPKSGGNRLFYCARWGAQQLLCLCLQRPHVQFSHETCIPSQEERTGSAFSQSPRPGVRAPRWPRPALRARPGPAQMCACASRPRHRAFQPYHRGRARALLFPSTPFSPPPRPTFLSPNPAACLVLGDKSPSSGSPGVPSGPAFHPGGLPADAGRPRRRWRRPPAPPRPGPRARPPSETDSARAPRGLPSPRARVGPGLAPPPPPRARSSSKGGKKRGKK